MASYFVLSCILLLVRLCYIKVTYGGHIWGHLHLYVTPCVTGWLIVSCFQSFSLQVLLSMRGVCNEYMNPLKETGVDAYMPLLRHFRNELFVYMFFLLPLDWKPGERQCLRKLLLWRSCSWEEPRLPHNEQTIWVRSNFYCREILMTAWSRLSP